MGNPTYNRYLKQPDCMMKKGGHVNPTTWVNDQLSRRDGQGVDTATCKLSSEEVRHTQAGAACEGPGAANMCAGKGS